MDYTPEDNVGSEYLRHRFGGMVEAAYHADRHGTLLAYAGPRPPIDPYVSPAWGTVSTFYPGASAVDGRVARSVGGAGESFATLRAGVGTTSNSNAGSETFIQTYATSTTNKWGTM